MRFNTQPPEGGWDKLDGADTYDVVSTHSRLKAAGGDCSVKRGDDGFNTQPPEGGWSDIISGNVGQRPLQKSPSFDNRNPNTGFRLFSPLIAPNFTQIPP